MTGTSTINNFSRRDKEMHLYCTCLVQSQRMEMMTEPTLPPNNLSYVFGAGHRHTLGHVDAPFAVAQRGALVSQHWMCMWGHVEAPRAVVLRRRGAGGRRAAGAARMVEQRQVHVSASVAVLGHGARRGRVHGVHFVQRHERELVDGEAQRFLVPLVAAVRFRFYRQRDSGLLRAHYRVVVHDVWVEQRARHAARRSALDVMGNGFLRGKANNSINIYIYKTHNKITPTVV